MTAENMYAMNLLSPQLQGKHFKMKTMKQIFKKESFYFSYSKKSFLTLPLFILFSYIFAWQLIVVQPTGGSFLGAICTICLYIGIYLTIPKIWVNIKGKITLKVMCTSILCLLYWVLLGLSTLI